jgi:heme a synthase
MQDMDSRNEKSPREADRPLAVAYWLFGVAALIYAIAVIGAITRLTGSGLSIAVWEPIMGAVPPMRDAEWERMFALYRETPQFNWINARMTLAEFKGIFWWEYAHRLGGRLVGLCYALPLLWFWLRGELSQRLRRRLLWILALGVAQGGLGWFMVMSGLAEQTTVSPYRLAGHLMLAVGIYAALLWTAFDLLDIAPAAAAPRRLRIAAAHLLAFVALTILAGAFVAGLDAGMVYNSFPLMDGRLWPEGLYGMRPWILSAFEDAGTVQFQHRVLAYATLAAALLAWRAGRGAGAVGRIAAIAAALVIGQTGLGVATLLLQVPTALAALHQAGALALFTVALLLVRAARR